MGEDDYFSKLDEAMSTLGKTLILINGSATIALLGLLGTLLDKKIYLGYINSGLENFSLGFRNALVFFILWKLIFMVGLSIKSHYKGKIPEDYVSIFISYIFPMLITFLLTLSFFNFLSGVSIVSLGLEKINDL
ncbi:MAG: hypothetical protein H6861_05045 [Rhodospirillales bacterium]|nr:hypothetical protein [Rhodospirillales bacterium]